jgi:hypothetical protein
MDPYTFAQQQGQVIGSKADLDDDPADAEDLMDLLLRACARDGYMADMTEAERTAIAVFADFSNKYLTEHRVVSTGIVDGAFSLCFEGGQTVPLATEATQAPQRPDGTVPITMPKEHKMKGMNVVDNSVPVTTGSVGSPTRRSGKG